MKKTLVIFLLGALAISIISTTNAQDACDKSVWEGQGKCETSFNRDPSKQCCIYLLDCSQNSIDKDKFGEDACFFDPDLRMTLYSPKPCIEFNPCTEN